MKIVALNLNHKASLRAIKPRLVEVVERLGPEILVLNEYVHGEERAALVDALAHIGLGNVLFSERLNGHNQVLIASNSPITAGALRGPATPDGGGESNFLHVLVPYAHLEIVGVRAPAYAKRNELQDYWEKLVAIIQSTQERRILFIGDVNADPDSGRSVGSSHLASLRSAGWIIPSPSGAWSYVSGSRIDHAIASPTVAIDRAEYVSEVAGIVVASQTKAAAISDHAALVVQVRTAENAL